MKELLQNNIHQLIIHNHVKGKEIMERKLKSEELPQAQTQTEMKAGEPMSCGRSGKKKKYYFVDPHDIVRGHGSKCDCTKHQRISERARPHPPLDFQDYLRGFWSSKHDTMAEETLEELIDVIDDFDKLAYINKIRVIVTPVSHHQKVGLLALAPYTGDVIACIAPIHASRAQAEEELIRHMADKARCEMCQQVVEKTAMDDDFCEICEKCRGEIDNAQMYRMSGYF